MEISERLGLSKELTEAISLGHDIGTSPYGCIGNRFLQEKVGDEFSHENAGYLMLIRIAQKETSDDEEIAEIAQAIDNNKDYITKESCNFNFDLIFTLKYLFIYLAAPSLSCSICDLVP